MVNWLRGSGPAQNTSLQGAFHITYSNMLLTIYYNNFKVHIGQMTALTTLFPNKSDCVIVNRKKHIAISDVKCTLQTGILCRTRTHNIQRFFLERTA